MSSLTPALTPAILMDLGLSSLKQLCRDRGVRGYSKKRKYDIVNLLLNSTITDLEKSLFEKSLYDLRDICRCKGIIGAFRKTKSEIVRMLATNPPSAEEAVFNSEAEIAMRANGWKRDRAWLRAIAAARLTAANHVFEADTETEAEAETEGDILMREADILLREAETVMRSDLPPKSSVFESFDTFSLLDVVQSGEVIKEVDMLELSRLLMAVYKSAA